MSKRKLNEKLYYDLEAINNFIFGEDSRDSNTEITETLLTDNSGNLTTDNRIIREVKTVDSNKQTIRYDIIKMFMDVLNNVEIDQDDMPLSFGENMIINTMIANGLVREND